MKLISILIWPLCFFLLTACSSAEKREENDRAEQAKLAEAAKLNRSRVNYSVNREERVLRIKFKVPPHRGGTYACTSCAENIARELRKLSGILQVQPYPDDESVVVYFQSGKTDVDEMKKVIKAKGFQTYIAWGPEARRLDGRPELIQYTEIPKDQPTISRAWQEKEDIEKMKRLREEQKLKGYVVPKVYSQDKYKR